MDVFKILVVDDEPEFRNAYQLILTDQGYEVQTADSGEKCLEILHQNEVDLVITDLKMDGMNGLALLEQLKLQNKRCEVIMVTGFGTIDSAVLAIKKGAFGYFVKGQDPDLLLTEIKKIVKIKRLQSDHASIKYGFDNPEFLLSTKNSRFQNILDIIKKSASSNSNILIQGESGTGKEIIAKYIHSLSDRKGKAFIPVNCQTFTEGLLESELFGHEKGAFTGAIERRIGRFEEANQGTLFLDEIGELSQSTQIKLLRILENRCFERIGSNKPIHTDIRLISATNQNLDHLIINGKFRSDLLYRINTITLSIPPLRERREDIETFIDFFFNKFQRDMNKNIPFREEGLMEILKNYHYSGNIRELRNIIERLVVLCDDSTLRIRHLPDHMLLHNGNESMSSAGKSLKQVRSDAESKHIKIVLDQCNGNISKAARVMGISRRQMFNKLVEYQIKKV